MPINLVVIEAITTKKDEKGKDILDVKGEPVKTGCGPCIAFEKNIMPLLKEKIQQSEQITSVIPLHQASMAGPRHQRMPNTIRRANPNWFPCILAVNSEDWQNTENNPDATLRMLFYNGEYDNGKLIPRNAAITVDAIMNWLQNTAVPALAPNSSAGNKRQLVAAEQAPGGAIRTYKLTSGIRNGLVGRRFTPM